MDSPPRKKKRKTSSPPREPRVNDFQKNDLELLQSGDLADGTIKCQGRTWKVHRALLSSRLRFFKSAFCGGFAEATSREVDLPEATPDSVDIMIRHLYSEELDVEALNTPLLCICSWKLADYVRLHTLKSVAASALQEHLNAMLLLASSDKDLTEIKPEPIWLTHFMDAFREVCAHAFLRPLQNEFVAFLWVARFEMLGLDEIWETLDKHQDVRAQLLNLLIWHEFEETPLLIPCCYDIDGKIQRKEKSVIEMRNKCANCRQDRFSDYYTEGEGPGEPWFYNPLPITVDSKPLPHDDIGDSIWCKDCADNIIKGHDWPWRPKDEPGKKKLNLKAWSWTDGNQDSN